MTKKLYTLAEVKNKAQLTYLMKAHDIYFNFRLINDIIYELYGCWDFEIMDNTFVKLEYTFNWNDENINQDKDRYLGISFYQNFVLINWEYDDMGINEQRNTKVLFKCYENYEIYKNTIISIIDCLLKTIFKEVYNG